MNQRLLNGVPSESGFRAARASREDLSIPMAWLQSGSNNHVFTKNSTGEVSLVDYLRLTYHIV